MLQTRKYCGLYRLYNVTRLCFALLNDRGILFPMRFAAISNQVGRHIRK